MNFIDNFIALEGLDGSGKTTISKLLSEKLPNSILTREPGGCYEAEEIRNVIINSSNLEGITNLLLFNSARVENISKTIKPNLEQGKTVICDRFFYSTLIYQSVINNIPEELINELHRLVFQGFMPKVSFFIDCPITELERRISNRSEKKIYFDKLPLKTKEKMYDKFLTLAKTNSDIVVIDGNRGIQDICDEILKNLQT